ncbi:MAG: peptide deformylase, partial [Holosporales bacterium]|nr:peptide deformylase [Holosporales bacterium]
MAALDILLYPNPILRQISTPIEVGDTTVSKLVADMFTVLKANKGIIGLAAPQVGVLKRVVVIDLGDDSGVAPLALVNPEILWSSEETTSYSNGCASIIGIYADVVRPTVIEM